MEGTGKPVIAITMGDPCGIGPEVIAKALASGQVHGMCRLMVVGSAWSMDRAVKLTGSDMEVREVESPRRRGPHPGAGGRPGPPQPGPGRGYCRPDLSGMREGRHGVGVPGR